MCCFCLLHKDMSFLLVASDLITLDFSREKEDS